MYMPLYHSALSIYTAVIIILCTVLSYTLLVNQSIDTIDYGSIVSMIKGSQLGILMVELPSSPPSH